MSDRSAVSNELRLLGQLCDGVISVKGVRFQIHKVILCNVSPYFRALFERWSTDNRKVFNIPGVPSNVMSLIIEYAYTGAVSVTWDNVQDLTLAADMLNMMGLRRICLDFLSERLCSENCVSTWKFTGICCDSELQHKALRHITDNFDEVVQCREFLHLSVHELAEILGRDDLNVRHESTVFQTMVHWIAQVRLALTNKLFIRFDVMSNKLVKNNTVCLQMASDAMKIIEHKLTRIPPVHGFRTLVARPRLPHAVLLAIGGWCNNIPTNRIEAYDFRCNLWVDMTIHEEDPRAYHGVVFLNGNIYCMGGFNSVEYLSSMRRLDLSLHTWHEAAPMHSCRSYVSATVLNGCIYAIGGHNGYQHLSSAERYVPETNQWSLIASMNDKRSNSSCTTLYNKVYICGGLNGFTCLQTAEHYNPETDQWTMIVPMNTRRSGLAVAAYADRVFVVGGFQGTCLSRVESFDPLSQSWYVEPPMMSARSSCCLEVINGWLFVVGGSNGYSTVRTVEYYDVESNKWARACSMQGPRSALSCCVVSGLPNMSEYAFPRDSLPRAPLDVGEASNVLPSTTAIS